MMQKHSYLFYPVILCLIISSCFMCPALHAASLSTLTAEQDIPKNLAITSMAEFKTAIDHAYNNLQSQLTLKVKTTDLNSFSNIIKEFVGISRYSLKCTIRENSSTLVVNLSYKQAHKVSKALINSTAANRLTASDRLLLITAKNILNQIITPNMTDYDKELAIHDYIVTQTSYDYDHLKKNTLPASAYTAAGILNNHTGVCEGYSEAMKLLLNLCNIECEIVTGYAGNQNHAWNIVKIDNEWYMLDVTFDDPVSFVNSKRKECLSYNYFNVTSAQLSKDHTWQASSYPIASSDRYNYYVHSGLTAKTYEEFKQVIIQQLKSGKTSALCYVYNYDPSVYKLSFVFSYSTSMHYSVPSGKEGCITIYLS